MKLRIQDNSIRLRLTRSEIERLAVEGRVSCNTSFPTSVLTYTLSVGRQTEAFLENNEVLVVLKPEQAALLTQTDKVGIEQHCGALHILVEKDFSCLKSRPEEANGDYYPNPLEKKG